MARYQILYWRYVPLGVKAIDINGTVRKNLPSKFHEVFQDAAARGGQDSAAIYTTSGFRWAEEQDREGTANEVVAAIVKELTDTWDQEKALAAYQKQQPETDKQFLKLKGL